MSVYSEIAWLKIVKTKLFLLLLKKNTTTCSVVLVSVGIFHQKLGEYGFVVSRVYCCLLLFIVVYCCLFLYFVFSAAEILRQ